VLDTRDVGALARPCLTRRQTAMLDLLTYHLDHRARAMAVSDLPKLPVRVHSLLLCMARGAIAFNWGHRP
jgi:hypothetical protein